MLYIIYLKSFRQNPFFGGGYDRDRESFCETGA